MLRFKQFINEVLNQAQRDKVNTWLPDKASGLIYSPKAEELSKHIIPEGRHHIVIPAVAHTMRAVHAHLDAYGYTNHNYANGTTTDKHGREVSIGKTLERTKADDQLKSDFANDDRENAEHLEKHDIVISRHPYHVAEGSTNKPWKSCAGLTKSGGFCRYGEGAAARKLKDEIEQGTHVAYLVPKLKPNEEQDDSFNGAQARIDKATARIYLKPHSSEESGHTVLHPENSIYSKGTYSGKNLGFLKTLENFTKTNFPMKDGEIYTKNRYVYDDDKTAGSPKFNVNDNSIEQLQTKDSRTREKLFKSPELTSEQIHKLIDTAHPDDVHHIAGNDKLNKSHVKKLFDKNNPRVDYNLMLNSELSTKSKLIPQEMKDKLHERLIDNGRLEHLAILPRHTTLNKQNLHRLIDKHIENYNKHLARLPDHRVPLIPTKHEEPEGLRHITNSIIGSKTPLDQDHINQLYDSGNMFIHSHLANNNLLSYDQLQQATKAAKKHYERYMGMEPDANKRQAHPYNTLVSKFFSAHKRLPGNENKSTYDIVKELN